MRYQIKFHQSIFSNCKIYFLQISKGKTPITPKEQSIKICCNGIPLTGPHINASGKTPMQQKIPQSILNLFFEKIYEKTGYSSFNLQIQISFKYWHTLSIINPIRNNHRKKKYNLPQGSKTILYCCIFILQQCKAVGEQYCLPLVA